MGAGDRLVRASRPLTRRFWEARPSHRRPIAANPAVDIQSTASRPAAIGRTPDQPCFVLVL